jgi:hypothetical protein
MLDHICPAAGTLFTLEGGSPAAGLEFAMVRHTLVVAVCLAGAGPGHTADPARSEPEWIIGEWKSVRKEADPRPPTTWIFLPDGKATLTRDKTTRKGTYAINLAKDALEFREEREDGTTAVESFGFYFVDRDRFLLYPDGEWKGLVFVLKRPQIAE